MKLDKRLKKTVNNLVKISFNEQGKIMNKRVLECVKVLKRLPGSQAIGALSEYIKGVKNKMNETTLEIESSLALSSTQINNIVKSVKVARPVNEVKTTVNKNLLGGLRIKIGDMVFDDSVSGKITQLKGAITRN